MAYRSLSKLMESNTAQSRLEEAVRIPIYILERMMETGVEIEPTPESTLVYARNVGLSTIPPSKLEACGKLYRTNIIHQFQMETERLFQKIIDMVFNTGSEGGPIEFIPVLKSVYPRLKELCLLDQLPASIDSVIDGFYGTSKTMYFYGREPIRPTLMVDEWKRDQLKQANEFVTLSKSEIDGLKVFSTMFYNRSFIATNRPDGAQTIAPKQLDTKVGFQLKLKLVLGILYNIDLYRLIVNDWNDIRNMANSPEEFINQSIKSSHGTTRLSHMVNGLANFPEETAFLMSPFRTYDTMYTWQKRREDTVQRKFRTESSDEKGKTLLLYIWYYLWRTEQGSGDSNLEVAPSIGMES